MFNLETPSAAPILDGMALLRKIGLGLIVIALSATVTAAQTAETDEAELSVVAQWEADPLRIFDAAEIDLEAFIWIARPLVIFADSPNDPNFRRQLELIAERPEDLAERDVIVIVDTDASLRSAPREALHPRGFMFALIDKDGRVSLRKPRPWDLREISRSIDKSPLRQQEIEDRR